MADVETLWKNKIITLGTLPGPREYRAKLEEGKFRISRQASYLLGKIGYAASPRSVTIIRSTVQELGFTSDAQYEDVLRRTRRAWVPEIGPALRLQYPDQPYGERLIVLMEPQSGPDFLSVPDVENVGGFLNRTTSYIKQYMTLTVEHNSDGLGLFVRRAHHPLSPDDVVIFS